MLYTLNLNSAVCQLYPNKPGKIKDKNIINFHHTKKGNGNYVMGWRCELMI